MTRLSIEGMCCVVQKKAALTKVSAVFLLKLFPVLSYQDSELDKSF